MSRPSRSLDRRPATGLAFTTLALALAAPAFAQPADRWTSTEDRYDAATVASELETWHGQWSRIHGPLAQAWYDVHQALLPAPHNLVQRPAAPTVPRLRYRIEPAHLMHHQAVSGGGSLGVLHGSLDHPLGLAWLPHSMFAQGGRVYGQWGFARLLAGIGAHAERHEGA